MTKKILEFHKSCKACNKKISVALMRSEKLICPTCGHEVIESTQVDINFKPLKYFFLGMMPSHWLRNDFVDLAWDKKLIQLLDNPDNKIVRSSKYHITINDDILVWTSNYPYAYGRYYGTVKHFGMGNNRLPKRSTVVKLKEFVDSLPIEECW